MKRVSIYSKILLAALLFISTTTIAKAQQPPDEPDPLNAPIDGGVSLLIAAGVAYGAKKAHEHRKNKKQQIEK